MAKARPGSIDKVCKIIGTKRGYLLFFIDSYLQKETLMGTLPI